MARFFEDGANPEQVINLAADSNLDNIFVGGGTCSVWAQWEGVLESNRSIYDKAALNTEGHVLFTRFGVDLRFKSNFSTTDGFWEWSAANLPGVMNNIVIRYDNSSAANDPALFHNGIEKTVTELVTPVGNQVDDSGQIWMLGDTEVGGVEYIGPLAEFAFWNVELTDAQILAISNGASPWTIRNDVLLYYSPIWGNQDPEIVIGRNQIETDVVGNPLKAPGPNVELAENYV